MERSLSPIDSYHRAQGAGDPTAARASLLLAGQVPAYRAEAHLLRAIEALRGGNAPRAFVHGALASAGMPGRADLRLLVARAAQMQGREDLAQKIMDGAAEANDPVGPAAAKLPAAGGAAFSPAPADPVVDVLVPVYRGLRQTLECIQSALRHQADNQTQHRVMVLDDASPDQALARELQALGRSGAVDYVRQATNLGFIGNVNFGMRLHPGRDVVWLNADTRVHGDWLDRLRAAVRQSPRTATASPLSNDGQLASFPRVLERFPMPDAGTQAEIDTLARALGSPAVAIEVGCGFCLYVRRAALDAVGELDGGLIRGYGEDSDWCIRARIAGWRHVAAPNVFVAHEGNVSFGVEKARLVRHNNAVLRARYPDAERRFDQALLRDPLRAARDALQNALVSAVGSAGARWLQEARKPEAARGLALQPGGLPVALAGGARQTYLIGDWLGESADLGRGWVEGARELARKDKDVLLLLAQETPWENDLLATGSVVRLPQLAGLETGEALALAGCRQVLSLAGEGRHA